MNSFEIAKTYLKCTNYIKYLGMIFHVEGLSNSIKNWKKNVLNSCYRKLITHTNKNQRKQKIKLGKSANLVSTRFI